MLPTGSERRFDFPRELAVFLARAEVWRELQRVTDDPLALNDALLARAWALEPDDPADGSPLPMRESGDR
jgi:hypothetical protein